MALEGADQNNPCELGEASPSYGFQSICRTFALLGKQLPYSLKIANDFFSERSLSRAYFLLLAIKKYVLIK